MILYISQIQSYYNGFQKGRVLAIGLRLPLERLSAPGSLPYATATHRKFSHSIPTAPSGAGIPRLSRRDWPIRGWNEVWKSLSPAPFSPDLATCAIYPPAGNPQKTYTFYGDIWAEFA